MGVVFLNKGNDGNERRNSTLQTLENGYLGLRRSLVSRSFYKSRAQVSFHILCIFKVAEIPQRLQEDAVLPIWHHCVVREDRRDLDAPGLCVVSQRGENQ